MHCCTGSNRPTRPGQRLTLFFLALPPRNRTKARKFLPPVWRFQSCLLFDPLIIGTGKLYLDDDNGWLYSLCDAIRQRYIFRLQWSYISTPLPSATCITYPSSDQKRELTDQQINSSYIHEQADNKNNHNTLSSQPNRPKKKPFLTNIHSHIIPRPVNVSLNSSSLLNPFFIRYM